MSAAVVEPVRVSELIFKTEKRRGRTVRRINEVSDCNVLNGSRVARRCGLSNYN